MLPASAVLGAIQIIIAAGLFALVRAKSACGTLVASLAALLAVFACPFLLVSAFAWFQAVLLVVVGIVAYRRRFTTANQLRVLESIRAAKQCLACHQVDRGSLLGAFSYEFRPDGPAPLQPRKPAGSERAQPPL